MSVVQFPRARPRKCESGTFERKPKPIIRLSREGEDPIFTVIDHHRALADRYTAAVGQYGTLENTPLEEAASEIVDEACEDLLDFCDDGLLLTKPITLAGVAAFIGYIGTLEEWEQPRGEAFCGDKKRPSGWFTQLSQMLAAAINRVERREMKRTAPISPEAQPAAAGDPTPKG